MGDTIFDCGIKMEDNPTNLYMRKYSTHDVLKEAKKKKAFINGDYVRITDEKRYLTIY